MTKAAYHHGDLRAALLLEAERMVADRGPEGFSVREAARGLHVSATAAYRHFADREALLSELGEVGLRALRADLRSSLDALGTTEPDARTALAALSHAYVGFARNRPGLFLTMFGRWSLGSQGPPPAPGEGAYDVLQETIGRLVDAGELDRAAAAGADLTVWSAVHGLAALAIEGRIVLPADGTIEQQTDRIVETLVRGLSPTVRPRRLH